MLSGLVDLGAYRPLATLQWSVRLPAVLDMVLFLQDLLQVCLAALLDLAGKPDCSVRSKVPGVFYGFIVGHTTTAGLNASAIDSGAVPLFAPHLFEELKRPNQRNFKVPTRL